ncbi:hypothetical protein [Lysinibacillus fusiformis]|nr:hypothetical protein [Lysinibacillus fusiformis]
MEHPSIRILDAKFVFNQVEPIYSISSIITATSIYSWSSAGVKSS